ncbi:hypothetical protein [Actinocorallia longicatena]|uniref:SCO6045-like C-terminal domain-containing protein n=1 Tax=Actinocorallia longicatena TaxID=111803 RepID=A0ABP6QAR1_9ACTN
MSGLAGRQEALVRALVGGGGLPAGFDARLVGAAAKALLRKRSGEIVRAWPELAGSEAEIVRWAEGRPSLGSWRDGWEFAREHRESLGRDALTALVVCEVRWIHGGEPRRRRGPVVRRVPGGAVFGAFGRRVVLRR